MARSAWSRGRVSVGVWPLCIFFSMGVFYHCPTSFTTIGLNLQADRPDEKFSVKCNLTTVITLTPTLTLTCSVLLLEHNKGETQCHKCPNKPTKTSCKPVASMPQSHTQSKCHPSLAYTSSPVKPCMPTKKSITSPSSTAPYTTSSNPL